MDVFEEPTGMYSWRVSEGGTCLLMRFWALLLGYQDYGIFNCVGFAGGWVYLLRHASSPSLGRSGADVLSAHGLRRNAQLPANCARLKVPAHSDGYGLKLEI
jgi:hypothetical protein